MSVYRFNFYYNSYSAMFTSMVCKDGKVLDGGSYIGLCKNGKMVGIRMYDDDTTYPMSQLQVVNPFITSGYWTEIVYDPEWRTFSCGRTLAEPFIPKVAGSLRAKGQWPSDFFSEIVSTPSDIDMSLLEKMTTDAIETANRQGNDFRNKAVVSTARDNDIHRTRSVKMLSRESKEAKKYTKKQIEEAIARWTRKLESMAETPCSPLKGVRESQSGNNNSLFEAMSNKH